MIKASLRGGFEPTVITVARAKQRAQAGGHSKEELPVRRPCLNLPNPHTSVFAKACSKHAAGRSGADHQMVKLQLR